MSFFLINYLVLFLQYFVRILFVISHINTLQTVDVFWKARFSDVSFSSFYSFYESIMNEGILLLCLNQAIPLCSDVLKKGKHIHIPS